MVEAGLADSMNLDIFELTATLEYHRRRANFRAQTTNTSSRVPAKAIKSVELICNDCGGYFQWKNDSRTIHNVSPVEQCIAISSHLCVSFRVFSLLTLLIVVAK